MKTRPLPNDLRDAQIDIDQWRLSNNGRRRRLPDELWQRAALLSRIHGVNRVAVAMRLNRARLATVELRQQGLATAPAVQPRKSEVRFVELDRSMTTPSAMVTGGLALELADGPSRRMRVTGVDIHGTAHILTAFFGEGVA